MGRRIDQGDNDVSLFPFLSILACIIGVLTLMISTLALSQMDTKAVAAAENYEKLEAEFDARQKELADLEQRLKEASETFDATADKDQQELARLKKELDESQSLFLAAQQQTKSLDEKKLDNAAAGKQKLDELQVELKSHQDQIAQLQKQLDEKKLPPEEAEFSVLPGGSGVGVIPRFVECTDNSLVLHQPGGQVTVRAGNMESDKELLKTLNDVAGNPDAKVIFLVRSNGVHVFYRAKRLADELGVPAGKLPVLGQGRINLQHFQNRP